MLVKASNNNSINKNNICSIDRTPYRFLREATDIVAFTAEMLDLSDHVYNRH